MSTATMTKTAIPKGLDARVLTRIAEEGYGPGAWHGSDLKAAVADVSRELAFWRPAPARHNIAEIALHHAWVARNVRGQLLGKTPEPFVLEGDDWFAAGDESVLTWAEIVKTLEKEQRSLAAAITRSSLAENERFELVLGTTCHAIYHAGQVQLIKALRSGAKG